MRSLDVSVGDAEHPVVHVSAAVSVSHGGVEEVALELCQVDLASADAPVEGLVEADVEFLGIRGILEGVLGVERTHGAQIHVAACDSEGQCGQNSR